MTPVEIFPTLPHNPTDAQERDYAAKLVQMILDAGVPALRLQGFTDADLFELRRLTQSLSKAINPADLASLRFFADKLEPSKNGF